MSGNNHQIQTEPVVLDYQDSQWLEFIESHPQATIFHHPIWINQLSKCYGYRPFVVVVHDDKGRVCAGLPVAQVNSILTGKRWVSLPFTDYCNPLYFDNDSLIALMNWFVDSFNKKKVPRIELRWQLPKHDLMIREAEYVIHTISLNQDPLAVSKNFKRTHRQNIHTAEKRGVRIERGNQIQHLRLYYQLQLETRHRQGVPVQPWAFFECLASSFFTKNMGFVLLAYTEDECIAGVVFLNWGKYIVAKYAASKDDYWQLRPNNLLFWEGIKWGCEHGLSIFDFGRTEESNSGLRRYKRGWGAVEQPITYSILSHKSGTPDKSKYQNLMQAFINKSPLWVCRITGELLYKHYG